MKNDANDYVIRVLDSPLQVDAAEWNALLALQSPEGGINPFMRHEYLAALHLSGSATPRTGWTPRFVTLRQGKTLAGACALYLKDHSYGEYVFDHAWANAYQQHGLAYYPKALVAAPFTPVPGARLLARNAKERLLLVKALIAWCEEEKLSSLHLLFAHDLDVAACEEAGLMLRHTVQFHWTNVAPTLVTACTALPPEGAGPPKGGLSAGPAPTLPTLCSSLPPGGAAPPKGGLSAGPAPKLPKSDGIAFDLSAHAVIPALSRDPSPSAAAAETQVHGLRIGSAMTESMVLTEHHDEPARFTSFDDFLMSLSQEKRKKIRQERRKVLEAGVTFRWSLGKDISQTDWDFFYQCYERTYYEHGNAPYLSRDFFQRMQHTMPENWLLFVAEHTSADSRKTPVATSLIAISTQRAGARGQKDLQNQVAYGRYWGALARVDCLHFEACYYQPLQWCIEHGLKRFEGGAQGEHKMARALLPVKTTSAHWLAHPAFADAVERFLEREGAGIASYMEDLERRNPFRQPPSGGDNSRPPG